MANRRATGLFLSTGEPRESICYAATGEVRDSDIAHNTTLSARDSIVARQ